MIKAVIVDDEPLVRSSIREILKSRSDVTVLAEFGNGIAAKDFLRQERADLLFLDIQMPGMNGLELAKHLQGPNQPKIIFVTAFNQHAIEAFNLHALHYILKPFQDEQLLEAVSRVQKFPQSLGLEMLERLEKSIGSARVFPKRFIVREANRSLVVLVDDVIWIRSARNYVELKTTLKKVLYRATMDEMEGILDPHKFVRVHRSTMVALHAVIQIERPKKNVLEVLTSDGEYHQVSASFRDHFESRMRQ